MTAGDDEIPTRILKHAATYISQPIRDLMNKSFLEGIFPSKLKTVVVKPILNNLNDISVDNFRPIALLPVLSKL